MRARIDGEGCCFCRQRLVTLNRLFMPDELKNLQKNFLVERKFHICIVLTRSVLNNIQWFLFAPFNIFLEWKFISIIEKFCIGFFNRSSNRKFEAIVYRTDLWSSILVYHIKILEMHAINIKYFLSSFLR